MHLVHGWSLVSLNGRGALAGQTSHTLPLECPMNWTTFYQSSPSSFQDWVHRSWNLLITSCGMPHDAGAFTWLWVRCSCSHDITRWQTSWSWTYGSLYFTPSHYKTSHSRFLLGVSEIENQPCLYCGQQGGHWILLNISLAKFLWSSATCTDNISVLLYQQLYVGSRWDMSLLNTSVINLRLQWPPYKWDLININ